MRLDHPPPRRLSSLAYSATSTSIFATLFLIGSAAITAAQDEATAMRIVADQVRSQGLACANAISAELVAAESAPDKPVYLLKCDTATYRVQVIPDQAAKVSKVQ